MSVALLAQAAAELVALREADPWQRQRRQNQTPPDGNWRTWLVMAGRGFGKTRTGAEWVRDIVMTQQAARIALVGPTAADARDVMVEGESGLLACCERYGVSARYQPSKRRVVFATGAIATTYSAEEPDRLRGPQHDAAWSDEIGAWRFPESWDMLQFGLRLGTHPRQIATTTPKPVTLVRNLVKQSSESLEVVITRGSTYDNRDNLAQSFMETIEDRYGGTRLGRQEIAGELLEDVEGALWNVTMLDACRVTKAHPQMQRIVVAIDPATTHGEDSDQTGIAVAGKGNDGHGYVLHAEGVRLSPNGWATRAFELYEQYQADCIVYEKNQGGEMVEHTLRGINRSARLKGVHAKRGKALRAEPIVNLYEQQRVHHVGILTALEEQMTAFPVAAEHDDIVDATVYALAELVEPQQSRVIRGRY